MFKRLFSLDSKKNYHTLIGKIAITDSQLSPSGTVLIDNEIYTAQADGENIEAGRGVRVTHIRGKRIYVKRV